VIHRTAALFLGAFLFCVSGVATGQTKPRVVHVFVALADNEHQGIVPVPAFLGNGDDPGRNLYWGAAFGVRTFFKNAPEWKETLYFQASEQLRSRAKYFSESNPGSVACSGRLPRRQNRLRNAGTPRK
jgi:hypothetical protein